MTNKILIGALVLALVIGGVWYFGRQAKASEKAPPVSPGTSQGGLKPGVGSILTTACVGIAAAKTGGAASPACEFVKPVGKFTLGATADAIRAGEKIVGRALPSPVATGVKIATAPIVYPTKFVANALKSLW